MDCNFADQGPWRWQAPAQVSSGYLAQNDAAGDCCRSRFGQDVTVPTGYYYFQLVSNTQPWGPCFGYGDDAAFANSLAQNINCSGSLSWTQSAAPAGYPSGYSTWTSNSFQQSGQFYFEFLSTNGTYYNVGLYPLGGATPEQSCGYIQDCNFADQGPWRWQSSDRIVAATGPLNPGYLVQNAPPSDCCSARFGQDVNVPDNTYHFQLVSDTQPSGPCFGSGDDGAFANSISQNVNCNGGLSWMQAPASSTYPSGYSTWTSSPFQQSGQFYFEFFSTGGHYYNVGLYGADATPTITPTATATPSPTNTPTPAGTPTPIPNNTPPPTNTPLGSGVVPWHPHYTVPLGDRMAARVDLSDGHVDVSVDAMHLAGRSPGLAVAQTWDSGLAGGPTPLDMGAGPGWVSTLTPRIGGVLTRTVTVTDETGAAWPLTYTGALSATGPYTTYSPPPGLAAHRGPLGDGRDARLHADGLPGRVRADLRRARTAAGPPRQLRQQFRPDLWRRDRPPDPDQQRPLDRHGLHGNPAE